MSAIDRSDLTVGCRVRVRWIWASTPRGPAYAWRKGDVFVRFENNPITGILEAIVRRAEGLYKGLELREQLEDVQAEGGAGYCVDVPLDGVRDVPIRCAQLPPPKYAGTHRTRLEKVAAQSEGNACWDRGVRAHASNGDLYVPTCGSEGEPVRWYDLDHHDEASRAIRLPLWMRWAADEARELGLL